MKLTSLLYFDLLRLVRRRLLAAALVIVPIAAGLAHFALPGAALRQPGSWAFLLVFAALGAGAAGWLHAHDVSSGLAQAITCTPAKPSTQAWSRALAACALFIVQLCGYAIVLAVGGSI